MAVCIIPARAGSKGVARFVPTSEWGDGTLRELCDLILNQLLVRQNP